MRKDPLLTVNLTAEEFAELSKTTHRSLSNTENDFDSNLPLVERRNRLVEMQRNHWRKLHTTRMTANELELWIQSIPGCSSCQRDFRRIVADNPPIFDDWEKWTWAVHNIVNAKLGKPEIPWEKACELWGYLYQS